MPLLLARRLTTAVCCSTIASLGVAAASAAPASIVTGRQRTKTAPIVALADGGARTVVAAPFVTVGDGPVRSGEATPAGARAAPVASAHASPPRDATAMGSIAVVGPRAVESWMMMMQARVEEATPRPRTGMSEIAKVQDRLGSTTVQKRNMPIAICLHNLLLNYKRQFAQHQFAMGLITIKENMNIYFHAWPFSCDAVALPIPNLDLNAKRPGESAHGLPPLPRPPCLRGAELSSRAGDGGPPACALHWPPRLPSRHGFADRGPRNR